MTWPDSEQGIFGGGTGNFQPPTGNLWTSVSEPEIAHLGGTTMRFEGKVALITAAANGIGRATAAIMAREGATVIAVDNHQGRLDEAVPALRRDGGRGEGQRHCGPGGAQGAQVVASEGAGH